MNLPADHQRGSTSFTNQVNRRADLLAHVAQVVMRQVANAIIVIVDLVAEAFWFQRLEAVSDVVQVLAKHKTFIAFHSSETIAERDRPAVDHKVFGTGTYAISFCRCAVEEKNGESKDAIPESLHSCLI